MFEWITPFIEWLRSYFDAILAALNPISWIESAAEQFAELLPDASPDVEWFATELSASVALVAPYVQYLDFFIDVRLALAAAALMLATEIAVGFYRAWRMVRSLLT